MSTSTRHAEGRPESDPESQSALRVSGLRVRRSGRDVIDDVHFTIGEGVTVILGPNGAGKSTLLGALVGLIPIRSGAVELGSVMGADRVPERGLGFVPQDTELPSGVRLRDAVEYAAWLQRVPARGRRAAVTEALRAVRLQDRADVRVGRLSGGMRRRAQIAMALVHDPQLLVCDEPSVGLDPEEQAAFRDVMRANGAGRRIVISTHILDDAVVLADKLLVLADGRIAFDGTVDGLVATAGESNVGDRTRELERAYVALLAARRAGA